jgi:hypothetical protein
MRMDVKYWGHIVSSSYEQLTDVHPCWQIKHKIVGYMQDAYIYRLKR